ncbi:MAG: hypothetical protein LBL37_01595 [Gracilibacteraceae bacterium]|nr:hypothetical protein [Gracilibacteraceae bacterium]
MDDHRRHQHRRGRQSGNAKERQGMSRAGTGTIPARSNTRRYISARRTAIPVIRPAVGRGRKRLFIHFPPDKGGMRGFGAENPTKKPISPLQTPPVLPLSGEERNDKRSRIMMSAFMRLIWTRGESTLVFVRKWYDKGGQYDCPLYEKEGSFMRMNFPFRHKIAIMAVAADISMFALIYVIYFHVVSMDEVFLNSRQDHLLYFFLIDAWGWFHVPVVLLPISSSIFCYESCHVVGIIRNTIHMILCFSQTYIIFYILGFFVGNKEKRQ